MCGILGLVGDAARSQAAGPFIGARDSMTHRGPDGAGDSRFEGARLGFRRLAILDLSERGAQPMTSADGKTGLVFNGEIYNHRELRAELGRSREFRSQADSEVLLHGYAEWGWEGLLRRIEGMFAFAIWDGAKRELLAARDRAGKKPFFYAPLPGGLVFASTLEALRAAADRSFTPDLEAVDAFLVFQAVPAPLTMFRGVRQLEPAHWLRFRASDGLLETRRYWRAEFGPKWNKSENELVDDIDALVRAAVRKRMVSDVPVGALLSGGVDSSLAVAMMARESARPVQAVVMGFDDSRYDETEHARAVARRVGADLHEYRLGADAMEELPRMIWRIGQPLADVSVPPTYRVAQALRGHVTVAINGDGGDELFGGYARPVVARVLRWYRWLIPGFLRGPLAGGPARIAPRSLAMLMRAGARDGADSFAYDRGFLDWRSAAYASPLLQAAERADARGRYETAWREAAAEDDVDRVLSLDFGAYLPDQLLAKMDGATMAHSVEARSPLLDHALTEYAARIPHHLRLRGLTTKYLLKRVAERYVPRKTVWRRKRGFVMPAAEWLRGPMLESVRALFESRDFAARGWLRPDWMRDRLREHACGARDWTGVLWTGMVLELWARMALDRSMQPSDPLSAVRLS